MTSAHFHVNIDTIIEIARGSERHMAYELFECIQIPEQAWPDVYQGDCDVIKEPDGFSILDHRVTRQVLNRMAGHCLIEDLPERIGKAMAKGILEIENRGN